MFVAPALLVHQGRESDRQPQSSVPAPQLIDRRQNQRPPRQRILEWATTPILQVSKSRGRMLAAEGSKRVGVRSRQAGKVAQRTGSKSGSIRSSRSTARPIAWLCVALVRSYEYILRIRVRVKAHETREQMHDTTSPN